MVKAHPAYSGAIMTATFQIARELGWGYFEKLAKQKVLQVQSSVDPPKKLALGERAVMADGNEYNLFQLKEKGEPVGIVYPTEGTPLIVGPSGVLKDAPHPNAARLLQSFLFRYVAKTFAPFGLSADHSAYALPLARTLGEPRAWIGSLGLLAGVLLAVGVWKTRPFATFGALMSPELPLTRRQHEMITTVVSVTNRCRY